MVRYVTYKEVGSVFELACAEENVCGDFRDTSVTSSSRKVGISISISYLSVLMTLI